MTNPIQQKIVDELGLSSLSPEDREETLVRIGFLIYQNVLERVLPDMSDADQDIFEKMLDEGKDAPEIFQFLKEKVSDFEKIISEEAQKFNDRAVNIMGKIGK